MRCSSWNVNRPTRSSTIRTDCTVRQIVLLPDQQIDRQRIDYYFFSLTDRTDRMIDLTDCISASILDMSVSRRGTFKVPPEIFYHIKQLKLCFKIVFSCSNSTYQLGFYGVEIGSNLLIFKMTETMFLVTTEIFSF